MITEFSENNAYLIKLINHQVKKISYLSVIVQTDCLVAARAQFSKRVHLFSASMEKTPLGRKAMHAMLKVIDSDTVFVFDGDSNACLFANYAKLKATRIIPDGKCAANHRTMHLCNQVEDASKFMVDSLEKKTALDFYPRHYIQSKAVLTQMNRSQLLEAMFHRKRRVEVDFEKEWGYPLPVAGRTYNEILNRNKVDPTYQKYRKYVDKAKVRKHLRKNGFGQWLPPSLGRVKFKISKRLWASLPKQFVIKPTNVSGMNMVIEDKSIYNLKVINRVLRHLKQVHYGLFKNEPVYAFWNDFLIMPYFPDLTDYKFFCFNGKVEFVAVLHALKKENQRGEPYQIIVDRDFHELPFSYGYERGTQEYKKPAYFDEMVALAQQLSAKFRHVRVDLMGSSDCFYFGEFTFFPSGGKDRFSPPEYDTFYGSIMNGTDQQKTLKP